MLAAMKAMQDCAAEQGYYHTGGVVACRNEYMRQDRRYDNLDAEELWRLFDWNVPGSVMATIAKGLESGKA